MLGLTGVERSYAAAIDSTMRDLTVRAEVGSVMEGMLGDLEAWEWANKEEALKKELVHAKAQVEALQQAERALLEVGLMSVIRAVPLASGHGRVSCCLVMTSHKGWNTRKDKN